MKKPSFYTLIRLSNPTEYGLKRLLLSPKYSTHERRVIRKIYKEMIGSYPPRVRLAPTSPKQKKVMAKGRTLWYLSGLKASINNFQNHLIREPDIIGAKAYTLDRLEDMKIFLDKLELHIRMDDAEERKKNGLPEKDAREESSSEE